MSKVYINSAFDLYLDTGEALGGATVSINYRTPSGSTGSWAATVDSGTKIKVPIADDDITEEGDWILQGIIDTAGVITKTNAVLLRVFDITEAKWSNYYGTSSNPV